MLRIPVFRGFAFALFLTTTAHAAVNLLASPNQVVLAASLGNPNIVNDTSVTLTNTGTAATAFVFSVTTQSGGDWLSVSITGNAQNILLPGASLGLTISATPGNLGQSNNYTGTITIIGDNSTTTVNVVFQIINGQIIAATPSAVARTLLAGQTAQLQNAVHVISDPDGSPDGSGTLAVVATPSAEMGGTWLSISYPNRDPNGAALTPYDIDINLDSTGLSVGTHQGVIIMQCSDLIPPCNQPPVTVTLIVAAPLAFTTTSLPAGTVGSSYSKTPAVTGVPPYTWTVVGGALPPGLSLDATTGEIFGKPTQAGAFSFTLVVLDGDGATAQMSFTLTIDPPAGSLARRGVLSQIASGGGWKTSVYLVNTSTSPTQVTVNLWSDSGGSLNLPLTITLNGASQVVNSSTLSETIPSNSSLLIESTSASAASLTGWAEILSTIPVTGYGVFHYTSAQGIQSEGTVPLESEFQPSFLLPYDNVNGFGSGVALANLSTSETASVTPTIWDAQGNPLSGQPISLPANGHQSFNLVSVLPAVAGNRGLIQFSVSGGNVTGLGLRVNPLGGFTSTPKLTASQGGSGAALARSGVLSQVASAGGWKTSIYLVNTSATAVNVTVNFWADTGSALGLPLTITQNGGTQTLNGSTLSAAIAPNATLLVESTAASAASLAGWAEVLSNGPIAGYGVFHYTSTAGIQSEGTVPLESAFASSFLLPYDNVNQFQTGVALANLVATQAENVSGTVLDANGNSIASMGLNLPAGGHRSFQLETNAPGAQGNRGFIEFSSGSSNALTGLGLRVNPAGGFTSIPKLQSQ